MALFIIAVVVFLILAGVNKGKRVESEQQHRKATKTNVVLQKKIKARWNEIVKDNFESKPKNDAVSYRDQVMDLYSEYDLPRPTRDISSEDGLFFDIVYKLTKKSLYELGYSFSYDGKESNWQEEQKRAAIREENEAKYPWYNR